MSKWRTSAWLAVWRGRESLSRTSGGCLAWMVRVRRRKSGKARDPCHGPWALVEPRDNAVDIDGGSDRDVLQVGLRHAPIPGPSQAKGTDPLGERPFDASPPLIQLLALLAGRPGLRRLQRHVLVLGRQSQPSACVFGTGTGRSHGTRPTRVFVKFSNDGATALATPLLPPRDRQVALGAADLLLVPVHRELLQGVRAFDLRLPPLAGACGAPQDDALVVTAVNKQLRADIGRIDEVLPRGYLLLDEGLLDGDRALGLMHRGRRRVHVREQMRGSWFARFADMHHVACPRRVAFVAVARLDIVGRFDALGGRRQVAARLETHTPLGGRPRGRRLTCRPLVVALPRPAQRLHARGLAQPRWGFRGL